MTAKVQGSLEFSLVEHTEERVVSEMPITPGMKNPFGVVHAGAILWFADVSATRLVMGPDFPLAEGAKGFPLAIALNANFVSNQTTGVFTAVSTFVKRGRTVSVVRTMVHGDSGRLVADVTTNHVLAR